MSFQLNGMRHYEEATVCILGQGLGCKIQQVVLGERALRLLCALFSHAPFVVVPAIMISGMYHTLFDKHFVADGEEEERTGRGETREIPLLRHADEFNPGSVDKVRG